MSDRIYPAYNATEGKMEIVIDRKPVFQFKSKQDYRAFALATHAMEDTLAEAQPPE